MTIKRLASVILTMALLLGTVAAVAQAAPAKPAAKTADTKAATSQTPPEKGMVWASPKTKVYHKEGDRWYGKTKDGKWMTEAEAKKDGYHESKAGAAKPKAKK